MKWSLMVVLFLLIGGSWVMFSKSGDELKAVNDQLEQAEFIGDPDEIAGKLRDEIQTIEGQRTFNGILLAFLSAGLLGIVFVFQILPMMAHKVTHAIYDSAEMMEHDVMHDARSLLAQGEYEKAIVAFRRAADLEPLNRLPIIEIVKIQKDNLGDPSAAIQTLRHSIEGQAWEPNDAAYFLFRLAELYYDCAGDHDSAFTIMKQLIDEFPGTRHSANANHKLHEWMRLAEQPGALEEPVKTVPSDEDLAAEEAAVLARLRAEEEAQLQTPGGNDRT